MPFKKILVVDDEPLVRKLLERILTRTGAEIVSVDSASQAIEALPSVDLVITDVMLGTTGSGVDVARAAANLRPSPPVVAISGYAEAADGLALGRAGVAAFIAKPFSAEDILEVVEGLEVPRDPELDGVARRMVGTQDMPDVLDAVRRSMVFEALARTHGNKAQAAALLGISRQNLQKILARGRV